MHAISSIPRPGSPAGGAGSGSRLPPRPVFTACLWLAAGTVAAAQPTVEYALGLAPVQSDVRYTRVAAEQVASCTLRMEREGDATAWVVRDRDGQVLRSFSDTDGDRVVDRWSYFLDGLEVYRDIDSDADAKPDQCRWLGFEGTRWGFDDDEDGTLDRWVMISAEEAAAEVVEAVRSADAARFARLLPGRQDLEAAGFAGERLAAIERRAAAALERFKDAFGEAARPADAGEGERGVMVPSGPPGLLPADGKGLLEDVVAYDNVMTLAEIGGDSQQIAIGPLVRCGRAWRPLDAPQVVGEGGALAAVGILAPQPVVSADAATPGGASEAVLPFLRELRRVEENLAAVGPQERASLIEDQLGILQRIVRVAEGEEREFWVRQLAETIAAAVQEGGSAEGLATLEKLAADESENEPLQAYVEFRLASSRYAAAMQAPDANVERAQADWLAELARFVERHPEAPDAAEALLQMGIADEFSGDEEQALARYAAIVERFPQAPVAGKARGAARRLQSVGTPFTLSARTFEGKPLDVATLAGRPVVIHYWAAWCEPCKVDIARIRELREKYGGGKLGVVGVVLDSDREAVARYLASRPIPWPQLIEEGGLDGRLAEEFGVLTLPTMVLVGADGRVIDRNVSINDLDRRLAELIEGPP
jgi:thiol-disulfide isomerase/thioredoxin